MSTHEGGCHCGKVRFRIEAAIDTVVICDCSVCTKKGVEHVGVLSENFALLSGESDLSLYRFGSNAAEHWFCRHCGIHPFGHPRTDPGRYTVNARCLDDYADLRETVTVMRFDGQNHPKDLKGDLKGDRDG